ncbi:hypothetical protein PCK2_000803 [Pneumocystis canis]|nr:hypothetical protein PCK2_000803 [Pneumocystis canis]
MEDVFIIQSGSNTVNDHLMELLIMISACKGASAAKITAVMPYFPYSKQSKMRKHRGSITAKMVANLLTVAGVDHIITMDLHVIFTFYIHFFILIITDATHSSHSMFLPAFSCSNTTSVIGDTSIAIPSDEEENINSNEEKMITLVGDVENKTALILDDIMENPESFVAVAEYLIKKCGAKRVFVFATHGILQKDCLKQIEECSFIDKVVITNTYPVSKEKRLTSSKLVIIDISKVFGEAIRRVHNGESISYLFERAL